MLSARSVPTPVMPVDSRGLLMFRGLLRRAVGCLSRNYAAFGIISISITIDMVMIVGSGIDVESLWADSPHHLLRMAWRIGSRHSESVHGALNRWCSVER